MIVKMIVSSGKNAGRAITIKRNKLLIGRAEECDVRPLSEEVSRRHCSIVVGPSDVWVEDLGSRNGTFVNGTRIGARTAVSHGDLVRIGSLELRVNVSDPAARAGTDNDVSSWLVGDEPDAVGGDSTQTMPLETVVPAADDNAPAASGTPVATGNSDGISTGDSNGDSSQTTLDALKAARTKPGSLPKDARKKSDSSRDAAADALRKFFGNR